MDLRRVDLNLLVTLDVLLSERNVTAAGERLGLSQPAVSSRLNRLREMFQDVLFTASRRGLVPTQRARDLCEPLTRVLADLGALIDGQGFDAAQARRVFRIIATDAVHASLSAPAVAAIQPGSPGLDFALLAPEGEPVERRLNAGEVDLLLVTPSMMPTSALTRPLYDEKFVCVMRRSHPAAGNGFDLDSFCRFEHILVSTEGGGFRGAVDIALERLGRRRKVRTSVPNFLVVPVLLHATDMIATVPSRVARLWGDLVQVVDPPIDLPTFPISMGWSARAKADDGLAWLRARIKKHAND